MIRDGLLDRRPIVCEVCGKSIEAGELVLCNDGYARIYGEFVLAATDDLHEDNHPQSHADCAEAG